MVFVGFRPSFGCFIPEDELCVEGDASCQMECPSEPPVTAASWKSPLSMRKCIHLMGKSDWNYTYIYRTDETMFAHFQLIILCMLIFSYDNRPLSRCNNSLSVR